MKKTATELVLMIILASGILTSCKKGENDPVISLKSRDARVTGEWTLKSMESETVERTTTDGVTNESRTTETFSNGVMVRKTPAWFGSSEFITETIDFSHYMEINKDGSYLVRTEEDGAVYETTGYLWWLNDNKKKTRIAFDDDFSSFDLDQLKNKEMVWVSENTSTETDSDGDKIETVIKQKWTFEKD